MRTRKEILIDLVRNRGRVSSLTRELSQFPWDADEALFTIQPQDIDSVLNTFDAAAIEEWANAVEGREDLGYESEELKEMIHELANPVLFETISDEKIRRLKERLRTLR